MTTLVTPQALRGGGSEPRALRVPVLDLDSLLSEDMTASGLSWVAPVRFGPLSMLPRCPDGGLVTFLSGRRAATALVGLTGHVVVTTPALADAVPEGNAIVTSELPPKTALCGLLERALERGLFERLAGYRSESARVHPTAVIEDHVYVDDGAEVAAGAVLLANTYVGPEARIRANAVVGGDGFETVQRGDAVRVVRHAGGVWVGAGVQLGSVSTVDKGLYGDFTALGDDTQTDSHVYLAHNVVCGRRCTLTTGVSVLGWSTLGDDVWLGPSTSVNQLLHIGSGAFVGTGSTVRHDVPAHALVYGSTARQKGWSCVCHTRLESTSDVEFRCPNCGRRYCLDGEVLVVAAEHGAHRRGSRAAGHSR